MDAEPQALTIQEVCERTRLSEGWQGIITKAAFGSLTY